MPQKDQFPLHNHHVYIYYRWRGWVAERLNRHFGAFLYREFAEQEKVLQTPH